jgi:hypothetical protein
MNKKIVHWYRPHLTTRGAPRYLACDAKNGVYSQMKAHVTCPRCLNKMTKEGRLQSA